MESKSRSVGNIEKCIEDFYKKYTEPKNCDSKGRLKG